MHIEFSAMRRTTGGDARASGTVDAGQIMVVRDPDDESEWQYLGNPEVAATTSLKEVAARLVADCSGADGLLERANRPLVQQVRDAFLAAARQLDDALVGTPKQ